MQVHFYPSPKLILMQILIENSQGELGNKLTIRLNKYDSYRDFFLKCSSWSTYVNSVVELEQQEKQRLKHRIGAY